MKEYKKLLILVAAALILLASYLAVNGRKQDIASGGNQDTKKLLNVDASKITEIDILHKSEKFIISKESKIWRLTSPSGFKYDQDTINCLPLTLSYFSAKKLISEEPGDLSQFGLDKPSEITLRTSDGNTDVINIGNQTSTKGGYYVNVKGSKKVYMVENSKAEPFLLTKSGLKDTNVLSIQDFKKVFIRVDDIVSLSMERSGKKVFSAIRSEDGIWMITSPIEKKAYKDKLLPILNAIEKTRAKYFVDSPESLDKYGLDKPLYSLSFKENEVERTLCIGSEKVAGSEFYAMVKGSDDVFVLDETGFNFLDKSLDGILGETND